MRKIPPFKYCEDCGEMRPESEFGRFTRQTKQGEHQYLTPRCRVHHNIRNREHTEKKNAKLAEQRRLERQAEEQRWLAENPYDTRSEAVKKLDSLWLPTTIAKGDNHVQRF